jgi:phosphatidate cytidylyltransferase
MAEQTSMTSSRPARRFDWKNLGLRAVSALVLIPLVMAAVWWGGWPFLLLIAVSAALIAIEWGFMSSPAIGVRMTLALTVSALAGVFSAYLGHFYIGWALCAVGALLCGLLARVLRQRPEDAAFGVMYIAGPCMCILWLRNIPHGLTWTILVLAVTWATDIFAYAVGTAVKGPKLWPRFSPNKTWSGFIGGLAGAVGAAVVMALVTHNLTLPTAAAVGLFGGLATVGGDLWESMLKRRYGVKDSGDLIPGHGGILDRVDGLMFAILAVAIVARIVGAGLAA